MFQHVTLGTPRGCKIYENQINKLNQINNVDTTKTTTHLSLCSGYSGIGLGLKGIFPTLREIAHVEIEAYAIANLVAKMEESKLPPAPIFTNLKTFPFSEFRGCVDILSGGFPCQPFSTAGKRKASEDPRHLFPYIKDGIAACRPRLVFLENVEGIISAKMPDGTSVLQYVLTELESVGYRATAGVFSASEVGASHQRKRVFILAVENSSSGGERDEASGGDREAALRSKDGQECTVWIEPASPMADTDSRSERDNREDIGQAFHEIDELSNACCAVRGSCRSGDRKPETMADTERERSQGDDEARGACDGFGGGEEVWGATARHCNEALADTEREQDHRERGSIEQGRHEMGRNTETTQCEDRGASAECADGLSEAMVNTDNPRQRQGNQGVQDETPKQPHRNYLQPIARPGEEQFSYEEPRTKPKLGRAANGSSNRVDRLRACGNGVVPATAEKAFKTLINRLT